LIDSETLELGIQSLLKSKFARNVDPNSKAVNKNEIIITLNIDDEKPQTKPNTPIKNESKESSTENGSSLKITGPLQGDLSKTNQQSGSKDICDDWPLAEQVIYYNEEVAKERDEAENKASKQNALNEKGRNMYILICKRQSTDADKKKFKDNVYPASFGITFKIAPKPKELIIL